MTALDHGVLWRDFWSRKCRGVDMGRVGTERPRPKNFPLWGSEDLRGHTPW